MKKSIVILLSIFLSALIVYGGSGVNAFFYCCDDCRDEGTAAVSEHKCCEIHHHHHLNGLVTHYDDHSCDQFVVETHGECGVDRIHFDWQTTSVNQFQLQLFAIDLDNSIFLSVIDTAAQTENLHISPCLNRRTQKPPNLSKDDYFSLLTTLII